MFEVTTASAAAEERLVNPLCASAEVVARNGAHAAIPMATKDRRFVIR